MKGTKKARDWTLSKCTNSRVSGVAALCYAQRKLMRVYAGHSETSQMFTNKTRSLPRTVLHGF